MQQSKTGSIFFWRKALLQQAIKTDSPDKTRNEKPAPKTKHSFLVIKLDDVLGIDNVRPKLGQKLSVLLYLAQIFISGGSWCGDLKSRRGGLVQLETY